VSRPRGFEHFRYVGDKRSLVVYDLELYESDPAVTDAVDELMRAEAFIGFSPQTLAEARNRGYHAHRSIRSPESEPS